MIFHSNFQELGHISEMDQLPTEIVYLIAELLPNKALSRFILTCHRYQDICRNLYKKRRSEFYQFGMIISSYHSTIPYQLYSISNRVCGFLVNLDHEYIITLEQIRARGFKQNESFIIAEKYDLGKIVPVIFHSYKRAEQYATEKGLPLGIGERYNIFSVDISEVKGKLPQERIYNFYSIDELKKMNFPKLKELFKLNHLRLPCDPNASRRKLLMIEKLSDLRIAKNGYIYPSN